MEKLKTVKNANPPPMTYMIVLRLFANTAQRVNTSYAARIPMFDNRNDTIVMKSPIQVGFAHAKINPMRVNSHISPVDTLIKAAVLFFALRMSSRNMYIRITVMIAQYAKYVIHSRKVGVSWYPKSARIIAKNSLSLSLQQALVDHMVALYQSRSNDGMVFKSASLYGPNQFASCHSWNARDTNPAANATRMIDVERKNAWTLSFKSPLNIKIAAPIPTTRPRIPGRGTPSHPQPPLPTPSKKITVSIPSRKICKNTMNKSHHLPPFLSSFSSTWFSKS
mmetsp:Transcript_1962/g.3494  ORF Transcript_1962/g.3494 Transcript_1962/m.3494 type:complete len:279 (+) Transcript_1962:1367-2203(+)